MVGGILYRPVSLALHVNADLHVRTLVCMVTGATICGSSWSAFFQVSSYYYFHLCIDVVKVNICRVGW